MPPSWVGAVWISFSWLVVILSFSILASVEGGEDDRGRKYIYICVVKRFGRLEGVIQRVNGRREPVSGIPPCWESQVENLIFLEWISFLACEASASEMWRSCFLLPFLVGS